ncbi:MAG: UTP--glucose-1-phosphate uridylyltransferase GalU [Halobacteriovoraceae bacterium]|nr:UTP--glucose-1-phosphate uridylyltransferase GalU [Halobacteriovoraceae bacterium]
MSVKKIVIPVAGRGTRFLPATKQIPKEMIPIINIPMINYVVDEAVNSGVEQIIFVTSYGKNMIEDFFDRNTALEQFLRDNGKNEIASNIERIGSKIEVLSVRQKQQLGLGHAINCAAPLIGNETFGVILGDDLILSEKPAISQLIDVSKKQKLKSVIGVMEVNREETSKYGIVDGHFLDSDKKTLKMNKMVEKPKPENAPSHLATPGRYVLTPEIFDCLNEIPRGAGGEYQLTDAINLLCQKDDVYAHLYDGDRFDTGSIEGYLNATIEFALRRQDTCEYMKSIIKQKAKNL